MANAAGNSPLYAELNQCDGDPKFVTFDNYMASMYWTVASVTSLGSVLTLSRLISPSTAYTTVDATIRISGVFRRGT